MFYRKNTIVWLALLFGFISSDLFCSEGYIKKDGKVLIFREIDTASLQIGAVGSIFFGGLGMLLYSGMTPEVKAIKGNGVCFGAGSCALGSMAIGAYSYLKSQLQQDTPIMELSDEGIYYEGYGFYSWDKVDAPLIVEDIHGYKVFSRSLWIPILDEAGYIKIKFYDLKVDASTLLGLFEKFIMIKCFSNAELEDRVPLHLQAISPRERQKIMTTPFVGHTTSLLVNCIKENDHDCSQTSLQESYSILEKTDFLEKRFCLKRLGK